MAKSNNSFFSFSKHFLTHFYGRNNETKHSISRQKETLQKQPKHSKQRRPNAKAMLMLQGLDKPKNYENKPHNEP